LVLHIINVVRHRGDPVPPRLIPWPREPLLGPLGSWELVRLARRGQGHRARLLVLYILFLAFVLTAILWFNRANPIKLFSGDQQWLAISELAAFGNRFALAVLEAVLVAVVAMTPAYAAAALAEDKERHALDLLLVSPLSNHEIVLGKALGRLGFVLMAAAAALPLLAATTLFGSVSGSFIVGGCIVVVSTPPMMTALV